MDSLLLRTIKVETWKDGGCLTNASGFFFTDQNVLYLVTNRHVVRNESFNHEPDSLRVPLHVQKDDLTVTDTVTIELYRDGKPQWREHPTYGADADVVAVVINDSTLWSSHYLDAFSARDIIEGHETLPPGQSVLVVAFPLGFHDTLNNLPIVRQAIVASDFAHPFKGQQYFLTDARMHRGTSGAPVVARIKRPTQLAGHFADEWCLLGVHSAALDVSDRDPTQDDRLGLNCAWYARLIPEIINGFVVPARTLNDTAGEIIAASAEEV